MLDVDPTLVHRLFYPQVPLVFAAGYKRQVSAMPVVSYLSLSMRPPIVGVACFPSGFTRGLAVKSGAFSLSVLDSKRVGQMSKLAETSGSRTKTKVRDSGLTAVKGPTLGTPIIKEALASLECRLLDNVEMGDHVLMTGEVVSARAKKAFKDYWDYRSYSPILYAGWRKGSMTTYKRSRS